MAQKMPNYNPTVPLIENTPIKTPINENNSPIASPPNTPVVVAPT